MEGVTVGRLTPFFLLIINYVLRLISPTRTSTIYFLSRISRCATPSLGTSIRGTLNKLVCLLHEKFELVSRPGLRCVVTYRSPVRHCNKIIGIIAYRERGIGVPYISKNARFAVESHCTILNIGWRTGDSLFLI